MAFYVNQQGNNGFVDNGYWRSREVSWHQTEPYVPARHPAGVKTAAQTQAHYHSQSQGCVDCRAAAGPEESRQGYVVLTPRPQDAYRRAQAEHAARTAPASDASKDCRWGMSWLLILLIIFFPLAFFISYVTAWQLGLVRALLPSVGDSGTFRPVSCLFAQLLNIGAICMAATIYVRARHVCEYVCHAKSPHPSRINKAAFFIGLLSFLGTTFVANFQLSDYAGITWTHYAGALMVFGFAVIYGWLHVALSFITLRQISSLLVCWLRVLFASISTVTFLMTIVLTYSGLRGNYDNEWDLANNACQWTMMTSDILFLLTYIGEFRYICIKPDVTICSPFAGNGNRKSTPTYNVNRKSKEDYGNWQGGGRCGGLRPTRQCHYCANGDAAGGGYVTPRQQQNGYQHGQADPYGPIFEEDDITEDCGWGMSWILIADVIFVPIGFFISYIVAWQHGHIDPVLPFISDTALVHPESCIFAELLNFGALFVVIMTYVRARQVCHYVSMSSSPHPVRVNKASFFIGLLAAFGMTLVANFQLSYDESGLGVHVLNQFHSVGALMAFGGAIVHCWLTVALSFITVRQLSSVFVCWLRVVLAFIATATFIFNTIVSMSALIRVPEWSRASAACQWTLVTSISLFFLSYFNEFRYIKVKPKATITDRKQRPRAPAGWA